MNSVVIGKYNGKKKSMTGKQIGNKHFHMELPCGNTAFYWFYIYSREFNLRESKSPPILTVAQVDS